MFPVAGLRGTGDWGTDERPKNFRESILCERCPRQANSAEQTRLVGVAQGKNDLDRFFAGQLDKGRIVQCAGMAEAGNRTECRAARQAKLARFGQQPERYPQLRNGWIGNSLSRMKGTIMPKVTQVFVT